ncbi:MAG: hypothetical protein ABRQ32_04040 [Smithellaceae bacterium]
MNGTESVNWKMDESGFMSRQINTEECAAYQKANMRLCPFCGHIDFDDSDDEITPGTDGTAYRYNSCQHCGKQWRETYQLCKIEEMMHLE